MDILARVESVPRELATEALYYCLRALVQAGLPESSKTEMYGYTPPAMRTPQGIALAQKILAQIEEAEQTDIDHIERKRLNIYIRQVANAADGVYASIEGFDLARGAALLEELRACY